MASDSTHNPASLTDANEIPHARQGPGDGPGHLAEQRKADSESHILRVQHYVLALAQALAKNKLLFADILTRPTLTPVSQRSALRHGLHRHPLTASCSSPVGSTPTRWPSCARTPALAHAALERAENPGPPVPAPCHRERSGAVPPGKMGQRLPTATGGHRHPLAARIMAIADVYDALISSKVYKDGVPHDKAVQVIFSERGAHFDPDLVDAFVEIRDEFATIAQRHADTEADMQHKIDYLANAIAEVATFVGRA